MMMIALIVLWMRSDCMDVRTSVVLGTAGFIGYPDAFHISRLDLGRNRSAQ